MKNKAVVVIGILIALIFIIEVFLGLFTQKPAQGVVTHSSAISSTVDPTPAGLTPGQTTANNGTVACDITTTVVTNKDGSQQTQLNWNVTPGTEVYIQELGDFVSYDSNGVVLSPVLRKNEGYTLKVTTGISTSTCQTSVTPTSFSTDMPAEGIQVLPGNINHSKE